MKVYICLDTPIIENTRVFAVSNPDFDMEHFQIFVRVEYQVCVYVNIWVNWNLPMR
jgi:hypothetical protein